MDDMYLSPSFFWEFPASFSGVPFDFVFLLIPKKVARACPTENEVASDNFLGRGEARLDWCVRIQCDPGCGGKGHPGNIVIVSHTSYSLKK